MSASSSTWQWAGGPGSADDPSDWTLVSGPGNASDLPQADDTVIEPDGTITLDLDAQLVGMTVEFGATAEGPATLIFTGDSATTSTDANTLLTTAVPGTATAESSEIEAQGTVVNNGTIAAAGPAGSSLTLDISGATIGETTLSGDFVNAGQISVAAGNTLGISVASGATFANSGAIDVNGAAAITGSLTGSGTVSLGSGATLTLGGGASGGTIEFDAAAAQLALADDTAFTDTISGLQVAAGAADAADGDIIDITGQTVSITGIGGLGTTSGAVTLSDGAVLTLANIGATGWAPSAVSDGDGGTDIVFHPNGLAIPSLSAATLYVHKGDDGGSATEAIVVANLAPPDGAFENLQAEVVGFTGAIASASGTTGAVAAGGSNDIALTVTLADAGYGIFSGDVEVALTSDGSGIDSDGTTSLGTVLVPVTIDVNQYAVAAIEQLSGDGSVQPTGVATAYTLDLGATPQDGASLSANLAVLNDVIGASDQLGGSFSAAGAPELGDTGLDPFTGLAGGQTDSAPTVALASGAVGTFMQTVTLDPTDSNPGGYSAALASATLTVVGTVLPLSTPTGAPASPVPLANVWGMDHITTFDGLYYDFEDAGEYVLTRSTVAGDTFQVQARLQPYDGNNSFSDQTEVGAQVGTDDIAFAVDEASPFYQNGTAETVGIGSTLALDGGSVTQLSADAYRVNWSTGESMSVTLDGSYIDESIALTAADAGNVQGLLGPDDGDPATDIQLPDGTPLAQNGTISSSELYDSYASEWSVQSSPDSLLDYGSGESFGGFGIPGYPSDALQLTQLPANIVAAAESIVEDATFQLSEYSALAVVGHQSIGVTDPILLVAAVEDLLATGDPDTVFAADSVQQQGVTLAVAAISIPTPLPAVGILANQPTALESATGPAAITFSIYLTAAAGAQSSTIDYSVTTPGSGYLGTDAIVGGTESGSVELAAGQTSATITIDVAADALGAAPEANLQVTVTSTGGERVFGGIAQTEIVNPTPAAGTPAQLLAELLRGSGTLTGSGSEYVLNFGTVAQGSAAPYANLGFANGAAGPADDLFGAFAISGDGAFTNTGFAAALSGSLGDSSAVSSLAALAPGATDAQPLITLATGSPGSFVETIVIDPTDNNASGYSAAMSPVTLTVEGDVACFCAGARILTEHGEVAVERLSAGLRLRTADGRLRPLRWLGRSRIAWRGIDPLRLLPVRIAAGALGRGRPTRDLLLSPGHAIFLDGILIQAGALVNGTSIMREADMPDMFTYWHVEVDSHELIVADGAAVESFLSGVEDIGFDNWHERVAPADAQELAYPRCKSARQVPRPIAARLAAWRLTPLPVAA